MTPHVYTLYFNFNIYLVLPFAMMMVLHHISGGFRSLTDLQRVSIHFRSAHSDCVSNNNSDKPKSASLNDYARIFRAPKPDFIGITVFVVSGRWTTRI